MEWTNDEVLEFLKLYKAQPAIWNPKNTGHSNRNTVHDAWKEIERKLSVKTDITEMKKKKDSLMATYRKLLNKARARKNTGAKDVFKPNWFAYNAMQFLHDVYEAKKTTPTAEHLENSLDGSEMTSEGGQLQDSVEMDVSQNLDNNFISSSNNKVTKKRKTDDKVEIIENRKDEAFTFLKQLSQSPVKTKCSLFTDLLCVKLQALNEQKQDIAMMEIDNIMFRLKYSVDKMVQPPSYHHYLSTSFPKYSPNLLNDNYSASSSSASLQPQPSSYYISSMPSAYNDLSQNQQSSGYSTSIPPPHFQEFKNPSPTPSQNSNIEEKCFD